MIALLLGFVLSQPADLVIENARIWSDGQTVFASFAAVTNGRFVYVGKPRTDLVGPNTVHMNAHGKVVLPGLIDAHTHMISGGTRLATLDLRPAKDKADFIRRIADYANNLKPGEWILGGGWSVESWPVRETPNKEWVDEISPTEPTDFSGIRVLEGERLLLDSQLPATVVRLGGIYGPGRARLIESVRNGLAVCADGPPSYTNRIHRDDCAGALRHLMNLPNPDRLYVGVDQEPAEQSAVLRWLATQLGVSPPRVEPSSEPHARRHHSNKRCRNTRLVACGYAFRYPTFREGYTALLAGEDS